MRRFRIPILVAALAAASCSAVPLGSPIPKGASPLPIDPGERWDPVLVCGKTIQRHESTVGTGEGPALEMVVLGDSILWGQGLLEEQKASAIVQRRLAEQSGRPVRKRVYAHSGATVIGSETRLSITHGEVPSGFPHVALQAECVPNPGKVDLVLVNGCINDIDATAFYPNPDGAIRYAEAILRALESLPERSVLMSEVSKKGN